MTARFLSCTLKKLFDSILPPFVDAKREKPREMLYIAQEAPPWSTTLLAGAQHALVAMMLVVYMVIAGTDIGLSGGPLRGFVSLGVVIIGFGTLLNGLTTRVSAGHLLVFIPSTVTLMVFISVANTFGLGAATGGVFVAGIAVFFLGRFLPRLRVLFPPEVTGVLLLLLGMGLLPGGVRRCTGLLSGAEASIQFDHVIIGVVTLATITAVSVWVTDRLRVLGLAIGAAAGLGAAILTGQYGIAELTVVAGQPFFSLPMGDYVRPTLAWVPGAIIPLVFTIIISAVDEVGCGVVIDRMNNKQWRRPDFPMIGRLLNGVGLCISLCGLAGTMSIGSSSAHLGLAHATGVAARRVGVAAGIMLMAVAFLPQFATFIIMMPQAVAGAIMIYTAAYMMVSGAELILSRLLNGRRRATVGLGLAAGVAVMLVPELTALVSIDLKPILGSGLVIGVSVAIGLNLLFRLGISQTGRLMLDAPNRADQAAHFLEHYGETWGARREVITSAGLAVGEALEALGEGGLIQGTPLLTAQFDEYKLILTIDYAGRPWKPAKAQPVDWNAVMETAESPEDFDEAIKAASSGIIHGLAKRVEGGEKDGRAYLRLVFEH